jgi:SnoaL-like domain
VAGREFYERHVQFLLDRDVEGLVETNYNDEAVLVTHNGVVRGREELKTFFAGYLEMLGDLEVLSTDAFTDTGDTIMFEATMRSALGEARVYDAFVLRDGRIDYHFAGVM